jgi:hypothetical protein
VTPPGSPPPIGKPYTHPLTGHVTLAYPGYGLPPEIALAGAGVAESWRLGALVWDPEQGIFWPNVVCQAQFCRLLVPGNNLVGPEPVGGVKSGTPPPTNVKPAF